MRPFKASALAQVSALVVTVGLGLAPAAQAQTPPAPPPPGAPDGAGGHGWNPAAMREHRAAERAAHIKDLHDILAIRPDQEGAFQAFAAAMAPEPRPGSEAPGGGWGKGGAGRAPGPHARPSTPERLDMMLKRFDERTARMREAMEHHAAAVKTLYAALSPEQRKTMDALPGLLGRGGGEWGGGDWGGGDGRGRGPHGPGEGGPPRMGAGE